MATYVIGDLHGCFNEWMELKNRIESKDSQAKLILLGDIEDRGHNGYKLIKWARNNITDNGKYQMVMGNHEKIKVDWLKKNENELKYYGEDTDHKSVLTLCSEHYDIVKQYQEQTGKEDIWDELYDDIMWMDTLPYYKDITINKQRYIITHASLCKSVINEDGTLKKELNTREKEFIVWERDCLWGFELIKDAILVHGHTPTISEDMYDEFEQGKIHKTHNRYNIDCGIVFKKHSRYHRANLAALRLEDKKEIYLYE